MALQLIHSTVGNLLKNNALQFGEQCAVIYKEQEERYTWSQLDDLVDTAAKGFIAMGVIKGDHVAIWGTNKAMWLITQWATARLGAVLVTINPEWKEKEIEYALNQSDSKWLVMMEGFEKQSKNKSYYYDYLTIIKSICPELETYIEPAIIQSSKLPSLKGIVIESDEPGLGMISWKQLLKKGADQPDIVLRQMEASVQPEDVVMIQYTSGTTGFPKGAMLSHNNIINNAAAAAFNIHLNDKDRLCGPVPYYHCFGSILVNMTCLVSGATMVIPSAHFDAHRTLISIESEKCTALHGVPTMFLGELDDVDFSSFDLHSLHTGIIAGAPVDKELMEAVANKMGAKNMTIGYGLTEASPLTHQTLPEDSMLRRISTVGKPIPHTQSKIVDPDTFQEKDLGEVGEIWVKGYHVMKGYYKKPGETREAIVDNWLRTGDLGVMDEDGYFKIVGRLKNLIIVGGHNVYPAEVEQQLHSLLEEKIELIQVIGVPHPKLQEVVAVVVKCLPGEYVTLKELKEKAEGKMEWPKIPRYLIVLDDFTPYMTVTGKLQKFKLKKLFENELAI